MASLGALLFGWLKAILVFFGVRFAAKKVLISSAIMVLLPIALWNFLYKVMDWTLTYINTSMSGSVSTTVLELSGLAGYIATHLQLPQVVSVLLSALVLHLTLRLLRI